MFHEKYVKYIFVPQIFCSSLPTLICLLGECVLRFKVLASMIFQYVVIQILHFYNEEVLDFGLVGYE
jgi:hypothetical protein